MALKATFEQSCGRTLHVTSRMMEMSFPTAFSRLRAPFYRTKITTWMASQEEEFRQVSIPKKNLKTLNPDSPVPT